MPDQNPIKTQSWPNQGSCRRFGAGWGEIKPGRIVHQPGRSWLRRGCQPLDSSTL